MDRWPDHKAWFLVLPVAVLVAFSAIIPLMTVVNYSLQDALGGSYFFVGTEWFEQMLHSDALHGALQRQFIFSFTVLAIEMPLGVAIALALPRRGWQVSLCLVLLALPLLIPWNVVGTIWQIFGRSDIGLAGWAINEIGINYNYTAEPLDAWLTIVVMEVWHWTPLVALLAYAGLQAIPDAYYQAAKIDGASALECYGDVTAEGLQKGFVLCVEMPLINLVHHLDDPQQIVGSADDRHTQNGSRAVGGLPIDLGIESIVLISVANVQRLMRACDVTDDAATRRKADLIECQTLRNETP